MNRSGANLQYADAALRGDEEVALAAVRADGYAMTYVSRALRQDAAFNLRAVQINGQALQLVDEAHRTPALCLAAVEQCGMVLSCCPLPLRSDPAFVTRAAVADWRALASARCPADDDLLMAATRAWPLAGEDLDLDQCAAVLVLRPSGEQRLLQVTG